MNSQDETASPGLSLENRGGGGPKGKGLRPMATSPNPPTTHLPPPPSDTYPAFSKIERLDSQPMFITQKIHGTNALIYVFRTEDGVLSLRCGSRTRWIVPDDDNYGFAQHVYSNFSAFIDLLGEGFHYGEWAGPGINSGEGLTERCFFLFDHWKFPAERPLPPKTAVVPVLYSGKLDLDAVTSSMTLLREEGSRIAQGFMRPEGIVVTIGKTRYKKVFTAEESQWKSGDGTKERIRALADSTDYSHLLQPIRLEKLLSRDSRYLTAYPKSLPSICSDYFADLIAEGQILGTDDELKATRKGLGPQLFAFVKKFVATAGVKA